MSERYNHNCVVPQVRITSQSASQGGENFEALVTAIQALSCDAGGAVK